MIDFEWSSSSDKADNYLPYSGILHSDNASYKDEEYYYGNNHGDESSLIICTAKNSRLLMVLRWMANRMNKIIDSYLQSPWTLIIVPMCIGLFLGWSLGRYYHYEPTPSTTFSHKHNRHRKHQTTMSTTAAFYYHWILILTQSFYHMLISLFQFRSNSNRNDHILSSEETKKKNDEYYYSCRSQWDVSNDNDVSCYEVTNEEERNKNQAMREAILHRMDQQQQQQKLGKTQTNCVNGNGDNSMEGESLSSSPRHVAVIMDGNRRYGKAKFGDASKGHVEGSRRLLEFVTWCIEANVQVLTVYAFSTENWNRSPSEVQVLMNLLFHYMDELTIEAKQRGIQIQVISTDTSRIPSYLQEKIQSMVEQTKDNDKFTLNICLSYGSRGEIVNACQSIVSTHLLSSSKEMNEKKDVNVLVDEELIQQHLQIKDNPDIIIRTSGEFRLSNFLLWQSAYSEFFFIPKPWPDIRQQDLQQIISTYSHQRQRRYGK